MLVRSIHSVPGGSPGPLRAVLSLAVLMGLWLGLTAEGAASIECPDEPETEVASVMSAESWGAEKPSHILHDAGPEDPPTQQAGLASCATGALAPVSHSALAWDGSVNSVEMTDDDVPPDIEGNKLFRPPRG